MKKIILLLAAITLTSCSNDEANEIKCYKVIDNLYVGPEQIDETSRFYITLETLGTKEVSFEEYERYWMGTEQCFKDGKLLNEVQ